MYEYGEWLRVDRNQRRSPKPSGGNIDQVEALFDPPECDYYEKQRICYRMWNQIYSFLFCNVHKVTGNQ